MTTNIQAPITTTTRRRTTARLAGAMPLVAAAALPVVLTPPAFAADNVICVGSPAGPCDETAPSMKAALYVAESNATVDTIFVGPGTYKDGPYYLPPGLTLKGSGQGATILTLPDLAGADEYVEANNATVRDLTIKMSAAPMTADTGLNLHDHAKAIAVTVDGAGTQNPFGIKATNSAISMSSVQMGTSGGYGIYSVGGTVVSDSAITGAGAFVHSGPNTTDTLSRVTIKAGPKGIATDSGTVNVDDAVIDLGSGSGTGLLAANYNTSAAAKAINANHVTIVGGAVGSEGASAFAANPNVLQLSTIKLQNSIVRGPTTALAVVAGNNGNVGGNSVATITVSYSSWTTKLVNIQTNGNAEVISGPGNVSADPAFVNAAGGDFRVTPGSPVVDHGDPAATGPTSDLDGNARVSDGDGDGTSVRDMGAYERSGPVVTPPVPTPPVDPSSADTTAPTTKLTSKPAKAVTKRTVKFKFKSNEAGATFKCKLDKKAWRPCTSPKKLKVKVGKHRFSVRATDAAGNTDATPATYRFKRLRSPG